MARSTSPIYSGSFLSSFIQKTHSLKTFASVAKHTKNTKRVMVSEIIKSNTIIKANTSESYVTVFSHCCPEYLQMFSVPAVSFDLFHFSFSSLLMFFFLGLWPCPILMAILF